MARPKAYAQIETETQKSIGEILRDHSRRKLSLEESAAELRVATNTVRDYLAEAGGWIGRCIYMPD